MYAQLTALIQQWRDAYAAGGFLVLFKLFGQIVTFAHDVLNAAETDLDPNQIPALQAQLDGLKADCTGKRAFCEKPGTVHKFGSLDPQVILALVASIMQIIQMIIDARKLKPVPAP